MVKNINVYAEGDKGQAICDHCAALVGTTYCYRDVPFSDGVGVAHGILVAVCDQCSEVVAVPAQSVPRIRSSRARAMKSVEAALPAALVDAVDLAAFNIEKDFSPDFKKKVYWYFIHDYAKRLPSEQLKESIRNRVSAEMEAFPFGGRRNRLSFKVSQAMFDDLQKVCSEFGFSQTDVFKLASLDICHHVLQKKDAKVINRLREIAYFS